MKHEFWTVAYRKRQTGNNIIKDRQTPFHVIPNNWRYWYADPHLFVFEGKTWVFAEAYDRVLRRGVISCCQITDQGATPWKVVLKTPYHLSYPHMVEYEGEIYMIPESYVADEIAVFKAIEFPVRWEKIGVLKHGGVPVDSTVFQFGQKSWLMSMLMDGTDQLTLWKLGKDGLQGNGLCVKHEDHNSRPAGHFFVQEGQLLRPAQDCTESYGCALNIYAVDQCAEDEYKESLILKIYPNELVSDLKHEAKGIHTYNSTSEHEIVDFKGYETDVLFWITRPFWFIWRRLRKVFVR